jgi:hypothetical protein
MTRLRSIGERRRKYKKKIEIAAHVEARLSYSIVYGFILERARATTGTATQVAAQALTPLVSPQPDRIDWALGGRARAVGDGNTH